MNAPLHQPVRPEFLLLKGVPDKLRVRVQSRGLTEPPVLLMPGNIRFWPLPGPAVPALELHLGGPRPAAGIRLPRAPVINCMADPDIHGNALLQAAQLVKGIGLPCLNHPEAVLRNTRDATARLLTGIPGLVVPVTAKVRAATWAELGQAMHSAGMDFPVIVRMAGDQGAVSTVRVDDDRSWELLNPLPWGGQDVYLTQYVDYRDADGQYRNVRIAVAGDDVVPCYQVKSGDWLLQPGDLPAQHDGADSGFMDGFAARHLPVLRPVMQEVARRLQLDVFAVDGSLRPDGSLLLFEANASNPTGRDMQLAPLAKAVRDCLARPRSWWYPA